eukprot:770518-Rhodomonas_salina.1
MEILSSPRLRRAESELRERLRGLYEHYKKEHNVMVPQKETERLRWRRDRQVQVREMEGPKGRNTQAASCNKLQIQKKFVIVDSVCGGCSYPSHWYKCDKKSVAHYSIVIGIARQSSMSFLQQ